MSDAKSLNGAINDLVAFGGGCAGAAYSVLAKVNPPIPEDHPFTHFMLYLLYAMLGGFVSLVGKRLAELAWKKVSERWGVLFTSLNNRDHDNAQ